jgi:hypothetical protein
MTTPRFDTVPGIPPVFLQDTDPSVLVLDPDGSPNNVIDADLGFAVQVSWELKGLIAPLIANTWHARLFAQPLGTGGFAGKLVDTTVVTATAIANGVRFSANLPVSPVQANSMHDAQGDGVYQLVVVISHVNTLNLRDTMAGFSQTVVIDIRKP